MELVESKMIEKGLNRADLAEILEINLSTLWRLLTGHTRARYVFLAALAHTLGISVSELLDVPANSGCCPRCNFKLEEQKTA